MTRRIVRLPTDTDYDPPMTYHLSDRLANQRTYYMVLGLWLFVAGSMGYMVVFH